MSTFLGISLTADGYVPIHDTTRRDLHGKKVSYIELPVGKETQTVNLPAWVRLLHPPVEGRLIQRFEGAEVGDRLRVQLVHTDVKRGYIDFKRVDWDNAFV
ncbi:MAG: hypothetical protein WBX50_06475 [Candidatus Deferrimicrobiaceae bacterium]